MALGLIDKLTNFLMPIEEEVVERSKEQPQQEQAVTDLSAVRARKANLRVHTQEMANGMKVLVANPVNYQDVLLYADNLRANTAVVLNFEHVDEETQRAMVDFLNGVCYVINGNVQRVSELILMYTPENVDISKELYAFSVPTYVKSDNPK